MANDFADMGEQVIIDFVEEAREMLEIAEPEMLSASVIDKDLANKIFRPLHTLKGISGSFGFNSIAKIAHTAETFLTIFRNEDIVSDNEEDLSAFLDTFDLIRDMLTKIIDEKNDDGYEDRVESLIKYFDKITKSLLSQDGSKPQQSPQSQPQAEIPEKKHNEEPIQEREADSSAENEAGEQEVHHEDDENLRVEITSEMIDGFKAESLDAFNATEQALLSLAKNSDDMDALEEAFRNIHSFKGNCGIFGMIDMEELSHKIETCLEKIKTGDRVDKEPIYELTMKIIDTMVSVISNLSEGDSGAIANKEYYLSELEKLSFDYTKPGPDGLVVFDEPPNASPQQKEESPAQNAEPPKPIVQQQEASTQTDKKDEPKEEESKKTSEPPPPLVTTENESSRC